jgi:hypothetical protein
MTVISATDFNAVLLDDVRTAALDDRKRRDDFELVFVAFDEVSH